MTDLPPVNPEPTPAAPTPPPAAAPVPEQPTYAAPGYTAPGASPYASAPPVGAPAKTPILSILALIGGIIGVLGSASGFTLLFSIAGVVLGFLGKRKEPAAKGLWITGIITGFVGIAINIIALVFYIIAFIALAASTSSYSTY